MIFTRSTATFLVFTLILGCSVSLATLPASAKLGVGVGTPRIAIEEPLPAGKSYTLPPFVIINTGDEPAVYEMAVLFHEQQAKTRPDPKWFTFTPKSIELAADQTAEIRVDLKLPRNAKPGEYFAYLEVMPRLVAQQGQTQVGIAAAGKLDFTVSAPKSRAGWVIAPTGLALGWVCMRYGRKWKQQYAIRQKRARLRMKRK